MSAAKDGPRDWDKELADIDKLIDAGGGAPDPGPSKVPARGAAPRPSAPAPRGGGAGPGAAAPAARRSVAFTWLWFLLAGLLGTGLTFLWPYGKACGVPLYGYLGAVGLFGLASLWSTVWSWRARAAAVHFLSIGLLFWSAVLGAREVLPRTGYAKQSAAWSCPSPAPAAQGTLQ